MVVVGKQWDLISNNYSLKSFLCEKVGKEVSESKFNLRGQNPPKNDFIFEVNWPINMCDQTYNKAPNEEAKLDVGK